MKGKTRNRRCIIIGIQVQPEIDIKIIMNYETQHTGNYANHPHYIELNSFVISNLILPK